MNEAIAKLITILAELRDLYDKMVSLSEKKKAAILENQVDTLDAVVKEEQTFLVQLQELERRRKETAGKIATLLELPMEDMTIQEVLENCPPSLAPNLQYIQKELTTSLQAQVNINEVNRKLLEARLEYISFMVDSTSGDYTNAYNANAGEKKKKGSETRLIDFEV